MVDLPQPDSPTMPSVSPGCTSKETPSTARTTPPPRPNRPAFSGKCFFSPTTDRTGGPSAETASGATVGAAFMP